MADAPNIDFWVLSPHAAGRMQERKVTLENISEIIKTPDTSIKQGAKWILAKKFRGRRDNDIAIVVVERKERNLWVVITVMVHFEIR